MTPHQSRGLQGSLPSAGQPSTGPRSFQAPRCYRSWKGDGTSNPSHLLLYIKQVAQNGAGSLHAAGTPAYYCLLSRMFRIEGNRIQRTVDAKWIILWDFPW